ncbi:MAG: hypothetical protein DVB31_01910 [Verrucomicrobia bacterium]|nr:MAG: hypothetical protein DVB31_01910 [Verrucomicrobiota bacterium]
MEYRLAQLPDGNHWDSLAVRWERIGPPLRPSAEDLAFVADAVSGLVPGIGHRGLRVLMLGVTPEYARYPWPPRSTLTAWERSESMIRNVWPGSVADAEHVARRDWLHPAGDRDDFDLVLGDAVLTQLSFPKDYAALCGNLREATRPGGRWMLRVCAGPKIPENPRRVLEDVRDGHLANINVFKLRMGMALCSTRGEHNVAVAEIWNAWDRACRSNPSLRARWSDRETATLEDYRDSGVVYSFPPLDEVLETLRRFARVERVCVPRYEFGDCCPTLLLEP